MKLSSVLAALAADPHAPTDLARVALLIARDAYSDMSPRAYLRRIDRLADQLRPRLTGSLAARTAELSAFLFEECGFAGNTEHYYDPRNSYLNKVLDRQVGLPIALSVLAVAVGTRAGLKVVGVGLPGHFIAKAVAGGEEVLFDPFNGGQFPRRGGVRGARRRRHRSAVRGDAGSAGGHATGRGDRADAPEPQDCVPRRPLIQPRRTSHGTAGAQLIPGDRRSVATWACYWCKPGRLDAPSTTCDIT